MDGSLAAVTIGPRVTIHELPELAVIAELDLEPDLAVDVAWLGAPPRLLVLARHAEHSTAQLYAPYEAHAIAEIEVAASVWMLASVNAHALVVGTHGAAILTAGEAHLTPYQFPARMKPTVAGAAGNQFVAALPGVIEEWDPQSRVPKRRLRLPRPAPIEALGGSERVVWMVTTQAPTRVDVLPLINRGQPRSHELPEPIAMAAGHPRSDLVACIGADTARAYALDLDGRARLRSLAFPRLDRVEAIALAIGRMPGIVAVQRGRPLAFTPLDPREAREPASAVVVVAPPSADDDVAARSTLYDEASDAAGSGAVADVSPSTAAVSPPSSAEVWSLSSDEVSPSSPLPFETPKRLEGWPVAHSTGAASRADSSRAGSAPASRTASTASPTPASRASSTTSSTPASRPSSVPPTGAPGVPSTAEMAAPIAAISETVSRTAKNLAARFAAARERREALLGEPAREPAPGVAAPGTPSAANTPSTATTGASLGTAPLVTTDGILVGALEPAPPSSEAREPLPPPEAGLAVDIAPRATWRDECAAWAMTTPLPTALPSAPLVDQLAARFDMPAYLMPALVLLYSAHLTGRDGVAPVDIARVLHGRWDEALGRGALAGARIATYERSRVRLATAIQRALDELAPASGVLVGVPAGNALMGACVLVATDAIAAAHQHARRAGGAILVAASVVDAISTSHADDGATVCFEARAFGAVPMLPASAYDGNLDAPVLYVTDDDAVADALGLPRF